MIYNLFKDFFESFAEAIMNRQEFGELVAALRQDMGWTQFQLAEYSDVDHAVISQIERGVKKFFEPELLYCLANALQLTTLERREFIFAASGLDETQVVRPPSASMRTDGFDPEKIVQRMVALTAKIRLPAFVVDAYGDVVAANYIMLAFYNVPGSMIDNASKVPGGYNVVRINFSRDLLARQQITDNWDGYALKSMRSFRENSLRYRAHRYCKYLMKSFRNREEFPFFDRFWKLVSSTEQDKDLAVDHFEYSHKDYGPINYVASTTTVITAYGELFLVQNVPLDANTDDIFTQLKSRAGFEAARFAPWPEKTIL